MRIVLFLDWIRDTSERFVWYRFHNHHTYVCCRVGHQIAATSEYHDRCLMETYLGILILLLVTFRLKIVPFSDLGGTSITTTRLFKRLNAVYQVSLTVVLKLWCMTRWR